MTPLSRNTNAPGRAPSGREAATEPDAIVTQDQDASGVEARTRAYVEAINSTYQQSVETFMSIGRVLLRAKAELPHGTFMGMIESELPFGPRAAQMLMAIASNKLLADPNHGSRLPASWRTLYELTKLDSITLRRALGRGAVHPGITRREIRALIPVPEEEAEVPRPNATSRGRQHAPVLGPPCDGMQFARMAIMDLEQIRPDDVERAKAFDVVMEWIGSARAVTPPDDATTASADGAPDWRCPGCDEIHAEEDLVAVRECSRESCATTFAATEGKNCPECNNPFTRRLHERGCPDCGDEGECEEQKGVDTEAVAS